jgi:hypothetical protein
MRRKPVGRCIYEGSCRASSAGAIVAVVVIDENPLTAKGRERFTDPVRTEEVKMNHIETTAVKQARQRPEVAGWKLSV